MKNNYKNLTYFEIVDIQNETPDKVKKYYDDHKFGDSCKQVYMVMKSFTSVNSVRLNLYNEFDTIETFDFDPVNKWYNYKCGNELWYTFDYRYSPESTTYRINNLTNNEKAEIKQNFKKLNHPNLSITDLEVQDIGKLGTYIQELLIYKLYFLLVKQKNPIPTILNDFYVIISLLIFFGVILPILILTIGLNFKYAHYTVIITSSLAIYTWLYFYHGMKKLNDL